MVLSLAARLLPKGLQGPLRRPLLLLCRGLSSSVDSTLNSSSSSSSSSNCCSMYARLCALVSSTLSRPSLMHYGCGFEGPSQQQQQHQQLLLLQQQLLRLEDTILASNWGDSGALMLNGAIWDAELTKLEAKALPFVHDKQVSERLESVRRLFDLLRIAEDVRDHINEIMELEVRSSGIGGTGLYASPPVEGVEAHAEAAAAKLKMLLDEYPEFAAKTEEALGFGLALLRQKCKFSFSAEHKEAPFRGPFWFSKAHFMRASLFVRGLPEALPSFGSEEGAPGGPPTGDKSNLCSAAVLQGAPHQFQRWGPPKYHAHEAPVGALEEASVGAPLRVSVGAPI
ncbi:hypothetical protein Esti_002512 [Eimeria stiedai]